MNILITGGTGFLGSHFVTRLAGEGHRLTLAVRDPARARARSTSAAYDYAAVDFMRATRSADWLPMLAGIDVVINAVGILRESGGQTFDLLHRQAPAALFAACASAHVKRVIQISALGADEHAQSGYHLSKRAADEVLLGLPVAAAIVQPSLVYGAGGTSARLFGVLASLPLIPLPGRGDQRVQPVHIDDLVELVVRLVDGELPENPRIAAVGPHALTLREFLAALRKALGIARPPRFIPVPDVLTDSAAKVASMLPGALLDVETLAMLRRGNTADPSMMRRLLGREPRGVEDFIPRREAGAARLGVQLQWLLPVLRASIAFVWILTGIVSLGVFPVADSHALLARAGVPEALRPAALYGAALLDLALGVLMLAGRGRAAVLVVQAGLILAYTAIISWKLPEFWLHPYGPVSKNLPMLAAIWLLYELESHRWNTST